MADLTNVVMARNTAKEITEENGAASQTIALNNYPDDIFLYIRNTDANSATITVTAPASPGRNAWQSDLGNVSQAVAQNEIFVFGPFDGARFKDAGEDITVTITDADGSAFSGTITNVKVAAVVQAK